MSGGYIVPSRTSILETLPKIVSSPPKIKSKSTTSSIEKVFFELRRALGNHPYLTLIGFLGLCVGAAIWGRSRIRNGKGSGGILGASSPKVGFFRLDGKDGLLGAAGLGGGSNGKVD